MVKSKLELEIEMGPKTQSNQGKAPEETGPAEKTLTAARLVWKRRYKVDQSHAALLSSLNPVLKSRSIGSHVLFLLILRGYGKLQILFRAELIQVVQWCLLGDNDIESPSIVSNQRQIYCPSIAFVL